MLRAFIRDIIIRIYSYILIASKTALKNMYDFLKYIIIFIFRIKTNEVILRDFWPLVKKINKLDFSSLSDAELLETSIALKSRPDNDQTLVEAFGLCREAAARYLKLRHYDVQLLAGIAIYRGMITEMSTGEGKTLAATSPAYLAAILGKKVRIVTVNDYLAKRDAEWMTNIYEGLGVSVGYVLENMSNMEKKEMYQKDIVYVTNKALVFDYLRDNTNTDKNTIMQTNDYKKVAKAGEYAILDEVDSILIDEAQTPFILSDDNEKAVCDECKWLNSLFNHFTSEDYEIDEKYKSAVLNTKGAEKLKKIFIDEEMINPEESLYEAYNAQYLHRFNQTLKAHTVFKKDIHYIVSHGSIVIIDEQTGRASAGRRYSEGLHQALEAKEGLEVFPESAVKASISFQNYFKLYDKVAGMTGTAATEAAELLDIYKLNVAQIPTHRPISRIDERDKFYSTYSDKMLAIVEIIKEAYKIGQPVLVGTTSVAKSEYVSRILKEHNIPHNTLNAKNHRNEAAIIAEAGIKHAVTVTTNMAGRGTDIKLGGSNATIEAQEEIKNLGGLLIIGTERNESRRADNQLRGRAGRQGDPGRSCFYISADDDILRIYSGGDAIEKIRNTINLSKDDEFSSAMLENIFLTECQKKIEFHGYESRKELLRYDSILQEQRKAIDNIRVIAFLDSNKFLLELLEIIKRIVLNMNKVEYEKIFGHAEDRFTHAVNYMIPIDGTQNFLARIERLYLKHLNNLWSEHMHLLDNIKEQAHLEAYAQKNPLAAYKKVAYEAFSQLLHKFDNQIFLSILSLK